MLLLTSEDPTTLQVNNSVGANTAGAAELLRVEAALKPRKRDCAEVRASIGDASDVFPQDLPN